ncbi:Phosphotransferase [Candidatus Magnetomoraceae bacterium gMMP-1]
MNEQISGKTFSFAQKSVIFSREFLQSFVYIEKNASHSNIFNKKLYSQLISTSHLLEDFLDFHGAKNNRTWYLYRELTATVRHLSLAAYSQIHIVNRLPFYLLENTEDFKIKGLEVHKFLISAIKNMSPVIIKEAGKLNIEIPRGLLFPLFPKLTTDEILEFDIDTNYENSGHQKKHIVKICNEFLNIAKQFEQHTFYKPRNFEELKNIVPQKINEVEIRKFEMVIHNLQSSFDSYVVHGGIRSCSLTQKKLRGFLSIVLNLLQMMGRLLHFYERHIHDVGYKDTCKQVRECLALLIDTEELLHNTINYGLFYVCHFLNAGKKLAREVLNENIERSTVTVPIPEERGFHMRPSLLVAKIVEYYGGQVELCINQDRFDASSVLDMQWAGGKIQKEEIKTVLFEGDTRALHDIEILASVNYAEDRLGKGLPLPRELLYLK